MLRILTLSLAAFLMAAVWADSPVVPAGPYTTSTIGHNNAVPVKSWGRGTLVAQPRAGTNTYYVRKYNEETGTYEYEIVGDPLGRWLRLIGHEDDSFCFEVINSDGSTYIPDPTPENPNPGPTTGHITPDAPDPV